MTDDYYISVTGLSLVQDSIQVGNVTFLKSSASVVGPKARTSIPGIPKTSAKVKNNIPKLFRQKFENHCIALVKMDEQDIKNAESKVTEEVEFSLNVLRFYLSMTTGDPFFHLMRTGMEGTTHTGLTAWIVVDEEKGRVTYASSRHGAISGYALDNDKYEDMKKHHFETVEALLRKPANERSALENSIATAIDLVGSAVNELTLRNSFLYLIIALESALLPRKQRDEVSNMSALINALFKAPTDRRAQVEKFVKDLYDIRSDIVHEGIDNVDHDVTYDAFRLAVRVIISMLPYTKTVKTKNELRMTLKI